MGAPPFVEDEFGFEPVDAAAGGQFERTLELSERFFDAVFDNPAILDDIPDGASLVFVPDDDSDEAAENIRAAAKMRHAGALVHLVQV